MLSTDTPSDRPQRPAVSAVRCGSADDAEVSGCSADDAEVVPPKVILGFDISRHDIEVCGIDKSRGSALRQPCIY